MDENTERSPSLLVEPNIILISSNSPELQIYEYINAPEINVAEVRQSEQVVNQINDNQEAMHVEGEAEPHDAVDSVVQQEESADERPKKKIKLEEEKVDPPSLNDTLNDEQKCSICLDIWSNYGEHRLCSLKCGHLFGLSCVKKWLEPLRTAERRCPECNTKASKRDIRILYAKKLVAMDTTELEKVKEELRATEQKCENQERTIKSFKLQQQAYEKQISNLQAKIVNLEKRIALGNVRTSFLTSVQNCDISLKGGCRVMAYNAWHRALMTTLPSPGSRTNNEGHGICKVLLDTMSCSSFTLTHTKIIRDITFSTTDPNLCLSVGFDEAAVLFDIRSNSMVHNYKMPGAQFWSCCWSRDNGNYFYAGMQNGKIVKYDIRHLQAEVDVLQTPPCDRSPVVSLASVPTFPSPHFGVTGFIACHLNRGYVHMQHGSTSITQSLDIKGPFMSVKYDENSNHALVSCRPNTVDQNVRHHVCLVSKDVDNEAHCDIVHTFNGGTMQQRLTRPCHMYISNDTLVAASNESNSCVQLWSMTSGQEVYRLPIKTPVVDTSSFRLNETFLALLTPYKVMLYKHNEPEQSL